MKRYEIHEGVDGFIIEDLLTGGHVHDDFGDTWSTEEKAQNYLDSEGMSDEELPYDILRRHHDVDGEYFYIWDINKDEAVQDEDGDVLHFDSYDEAVDHVIKMIEDLEYMPEIKATAEVKETMFTVYNTHTGIIAKRYSGNGKTLNIHIDKKTAQNVADMLNANSHSQEWVVAQIKNVELV